MAGAPSARLPKTLHPHRATRTAWLLASQVTRLWLPREVRGDAQGVGPLVDMLDPMQDAQSRAYAAHTLAGMASPDRPAMGHAMLQLGAPEVGGLLVVVVVVCCVGSSGAWLCVQLSGPSPHNEGRLNRCIRG